MTRRSKYSPKPRGAGGGSPAGAKLSSHVSLARAFRLHRVGRLHEAERICRDVLRSWPDDSDTLHFLGLIAHQRGDDLRAVRLISRAIAGNAANAMFHGNLAEVYRTLGQHDEAIQACRHAVTLNPDYPEALNTLGAALYARGKMDRAVEALRRAVELKPDFAGALANLGNVLRAQGKFDEAESRYREAVRIDPEFAEAHVNLGAVLQAQDRLDEALASCQQALRIKPGWAQLHYNLGTLQRRLGRLDEAVASYREALRIEPDFTDAHYNLAVVLELAHRVDEARQAANLALKHDPQRPLAKMLLARLDRRAGALEVARTRLDGLLRSDLAPINFARVSIELGRVLDRMGDYAAAFEAFTAGRRTFAESWAATRPKRDSLLQKVARNHQWITRERVSPWKGVAVDDGLSSPIFLVGFPRSGTTLAEQILASHPALVTTGEEPLVRRLREELPSVLGRQVGYPHCLSDLTPTDISRLRSHYWEQAEKVFGPSLASHSLVDKLPFNIIDLGLIYRIFPDARILVALRDPRDVCLSCFMQAFQRGQALAHLSTLEETAQLYQAVMKLWLHYRDVLNLQYFEFRYEDLITDLEPKVRQILTFIGENWDDAILRYYETAKHRYVSTPSYEDVTSPIYRGSMGRWRNYSEHLTPILDILEPFVREFGYSLDADASANGVQT